MEPELKQMIALGTGYGTLAVVAGNYFHGFGYLFIMGLFLVNLGNIKPGGSDE